MTSQALLVLEDGTKFIGKSLGSNETSFGEIVFNTGMTGYQETLTDPSYAGQIITFTYPEIGNYGCNDLDYEREEVYTKGMVIKSYSPVASNWRSKYTLDEFLKKHGISAIYDIDTRALTKHIRDKGAMRSGIASVGDDIDASYKQLLEQVKASPDMEGQDLASKVTCEEKYNAKAQENDVEEIGQIKSSKLTSKFVGDAKKKKVIAFDFGMKQNILNRLIYHGCDVEVVPADTDASYILEQNPDGLFLSNGPGDPAAVTKAIETIKELLEKFKKPIFGICLGHQLLACAAGAQTYKLKFGHRGANQPIKNLETDKIEIASHNHGFAVSKDNLPSNLEITHLNINDDTVAGMKFKDKKIFSVQYHPEASPGPHDSDYLFKNFLEMMV